MDDLHATVEDAAATAERAVRVREGYVSRLHAMLRESGGGVAKDMLGNQLDTLRVASVEAAEAIGAWQRVAWAVADAVATEERVMARYGLAEGETGTSDAARDDSTDARVQATHQSADTVEVPQFMWRGENYLVRMLRDLDVLADFPAIVRWLDFPVRRNPFCVPPYLPATAGGGPFTLHFAGTDVPDGTASGAAAASGRKAADTAFESPSKRRRRRIQAEIATAEAATDTGSAGYSIILPPDLTVPRMARACKAILREERRCGILIGAPQDAGWDPSPLRPPEERGEGVARAPRWSQAGHAAAAAGSSGSVPASKTASVATASPEVHSGGGQHPPDTAATQQRQPQTKAQRRESAKRAKQAKRVAKLRAARAQRERIRERNKLAMSKTTSSLKKGVRPLLVPMAPAKIESLAIKLARESIKQLRMRQDELLWQFDFLRTYVSMLPLESPAQAYMRWLSRQRALEEQRASTAPVQSDVAGILAEAIPDMSATHGPRGFGDTAAPSMPGRVAGGGDFSVTPAQRQPVRAWGTPASSARGGHNGDAATHEAAEAEAKGAAQLPMPVEWPHPASVAPALELAIVEQEVDEVERRVAIRKGQVAECRSRINAEQRKKDEERLAREADHAARFPRPEPRQPVPGAMSWQELAAHMDGLPVQRHDSLRAEELFRGLQPGELQFERDAEQLLVLPPALGPGGRAAQAHPLEKDDVADDNDSNYGGASESRASSAAANQGSALSTVTVDGVERSDSHANAVGAVSSAVDRLLLDTAERAGVAMDGVYSDFVAARSFVGAVAHRSLVAMRKNNRAKALALWESPPPAVALLMRCVMIIIYSREYRQTALKEQQRREAAAQSRRRRHGADADGDGHRRSSFATETPGLLASAPSKSSKRTRAAAPLVAKPAQLDEFPRFRGLQTRGAAATGPMRLPDIDAAASMLHGTNARDRSSDVYEREEPGREAMGIAAASLGSDAPSGNRNRRHGGLSTRPSRRSSTGSAGSRARRGSSVAGVPLTLLSWKSAVEHLLEQDFLGGRAARCTARVISDADSGLFEVFGMRPPTFDPLAAFGPSAEAAGSTFDDEDKCQSQSRPGSRAKQRVRMPLVDSVALDTLREYLRDPLLSGTESPATNTYGQGARLLLLWVKCVVMLSGMAEVARESKERREEADRRNRDAALAREVREWEEHWHTLPLPLPPPVTLTITAGDVVPTNGSLTLFRRLRELVKTEDASVLRTLLLNANVAAASAPVSAGRAPVVAILTHEIPESSQDRILKSLTRPLFRGALIITVDVAFASGDDTHARDGDGSPQKDPDSHRLVFNVDAREQTDVASGMDDERGILHSVCICMREDFAHSIADADLWSSGPWNVETFSDMMYTQIRRSLAAEQSVFFKIRLVGDDRSTLSTGSSSLLPGASPAVMAALVYSLDSTYARLRVDGTLRPRTVIVRCDGASSLDNAGGVKSDSGECRSSADDADAQQAREMEIDAAGDSDGDLAEPSEEVLKMLRAGRRQPVAEGWERCMRCVAVLPAWDDDVDNIVTVAKLSVLPRAPASGTGGIPPVSLRIEASTPGGRRTIRAGVVGGGAALWASRVARSASALARLPVHSRAADIDRDAAAWVTSHVNRTRTGTLEVRPSVDWPFVSSTIPIHSSHGAEKKGVVWRGEVEVLGDRSPDDFMKASATVAVHVCVRADHHVVGSMKYALLVVELEMSESGTRGVTTISMEDIGAFTAGRDAEGWDVAHGLAAHALHASTLPAPRDIASWVETAYVWRSGALRVLVDWDDERARDATLCWDGNVSVGGDARELVSIWARSLPTRHSTVVIARVGREATAVDSMLVLRDETFTGARTASVALPKFVSVAMDRAAATVPAENDRRRLAAWLRKRATWQAGVLEVRGMHMYAAQEGEPAPEDVSDSEDDESDAFAAPPSAGGPTLEEVTELVRSTDLTAALSVAETRAVTDRLWARFDAVHQDLARGVEDTISHVFLTREALLPPQPKVPVSYLIAMEEMKRAEEQADLAADRARAEAEGALLRDADEVVESDATSTSAKSTGQVEIGARHNADALAAVVTGERTMPFPVGSHRLCAQLALLIGALMRGRSVMKRAGVMDAADTGDATAAPRALPWQSRRTPVMLTVYRTDELALLLSAFNPKTEETRFALVNAVQVPPLGGAIGNDDAIDAASGQQLKSPVVPRIKMGPKGGDPAMSPVAALAGRAQPHLTDLSGVGSAPLPIIAMRALHWIGRVLSSRLANSREPKSRLMLRDSPPVRVATDEEALDAVIRLQAITRGGLQRRREAERVGHTLTATAITPRDASKILAPSGSMRLRFARKAGDAGLRVINATLAWRPSDAGGSAAPQLSISAVCYDLRCDTEPLHASLGQERAELTLRRSMSAAGGTHAVGASTGELASVLLAVRDSVQLRNAVGDDIAQLFHFEAQVTARKSARAASSRQQH